MSDNLNNQTATLASVIQQAISNRLMDLHTCMPGTIVSFDPATQLAQIQPSIKRVFKSVAIRDEETLTEANLPVLKDVPVIFPRAAGFSMTFPVTTGDECLIYFNERSIDNWNETGGEVSPLGFRQHDLSDAIAIVGIASQPNKISSFNANDPEWRNSDASQRITLKTNGDIEINTNANIVANCNTADINANTVDVDCDVADVNATTSIDLNSPQNTITGPTTVEGTLTVNGLLTFTAGMAGSGGSGAAVTGNLVITSGEITADGVTLKGHVHSQGNDSAGNTQVNTNPGTG